MAQQKLFSAFDAAMAGRDARLAHDYAANRNQLAELELADAPAQIQRRNALADLGLQGAQLDVESKKRQLSVEDARTAYTTLKQALDSGDPKSFILARVPDLVGKFQQQGHDLRTMDDASVADLTDQLARQYAGEAGIAPAVKLETIQDDAGGVYQRDPTTGALKQVTAPQRAKPMSEYESKRLEIERQRLAKGDNPKNMYRTLTPKEVEAAGLPAGTSAQVDQNGKIDVLSKRDTSGTLSQKDAVTAKNKLTTIKVARKQLEDIKNAYSKIQGSLSAGPSWTGQGFWASEEGKKFDSAVGRMRSTLTALTRVPGVGAMSDYETKLDQQKFPDRDNYESVTADQIQGIDDLITIIERGYSDLLSGGTAQAESSVAPSGNRPAAARGQQAQAPAQAIEYLRANPQLKGAFKQKYGYLPDGI
jgi:hypothetical protein